MPCAYPRYFLITCHVLNPFTDGLLRWIHTQLLGFLLPLPFLVIQRRWPDSILGKFNVPVCPPMYSISSKAPTKALPDFVEEPHHLLTRATFSSSWRVQSRSPSTGRRPGEWQLLRWGSPVNSIWGYITRSGIQTITLVSSSLTTVGTPWSADCEFCIVSTACAKCGSGWRG